VSPQDFIFVVPTLSVGGAERATVTMVNALAELGHTVRVIVAVREGALVSSITPQVQVTYVNASRTLTSIFGLCRYLRQSRGTTILTVMSDISVIVLILKMLLPRRLGPVVVYEHAMISGWPESSRRRVSLTLRKWLYPRATLLLTVSETMAAEFEVLLKRNPPPMAVIPNPIDILQIRHDSNAMVNFEGEESGSGDRSVRLLAVGRLVKVKDFGTFLAVANEMRNRGWVVQPLVIGDGPEHENLIKVALNLGFSDPQRIFIGETLNPWKYMRQADVLVMTSKTEGFGLVLLEAMACGSQIVSTDCGGTSELLSGGKYGQLTEVGNVSSIADAVEQVLENPFTDSVLAEGAARYEPLNIASELVRLTTQPYRR